MMKTARERAREATDELVALILEEQRDDSDGIEPSTSALYDENGQARRPGDAASNVWEPLLRDLLIAYEHAVEYQGKGHTLDCESVFAWGGYKRAKGALGG